MKLYDITLQHFANGVNTVVNYAGDDHDAYAGNMNANTYVRGVSTGSGDLSVEMKTFYDKALIELAEPHLVHEQFAKKKPIPRNGGKTIEFRKFSKLPKALKPITEGVTPAGNKLRATAITARVEQFGDYVERTDLLDLTTIDNVVVEATKELASQAGLTLDTIVRNKINEGTNRLIAKKDNGNGTFTEILRREDMTAQCHITIKDIFKAATILQMANAPKINGSYVCIIHPAIAFSIMQEAGDAWTDIQKYKNPENIYRGEVGMIGGVRFVVSTEARVFGPAAIGVTTEDKQKVGIATVKTSLESAGKNVVIKEELDAADYSDEPIKVYVNGTVNYLTGITVSEGVSTMTFQNNVSTTDGAQNKVIAGFGGAKDGSAVFSCLFLADGAYATTELSGGGLEHIVKQLGYGNDPLNQRASIGWKATKTAEILVQEYILRYECCSPEFSDSVVAN